MKVVIIIIAIFTTLISQSANAKISKKLGEKAIKIAEQIQDDCLDKDEKKEYIQNVMKKYKKYFKNGGKLKVQTWFTIRQKDGSMDIHINWGCRIVPEDKPGVPGVYIYLPQKKGEKPRILRK